MSWQASFRHGPIYFLLLHVFNCLHDSRFSMASPLKIQLPPIPALHSKSSRFVPHKHAIHLILEMQEKLMDKGIATIKEVKEK